MSEADKQILWKMNTRVHDWRDGVMLKHFFNVLIDLALVDEIVWIKDADGTSIETKRPVAKAFDLFDQYLNDSGEPIEFEISGRDWALFVNLYPYDKHSRQVQGLNTLFFTFNREKLLEKNTEQRLTDAFLLLHHAENTEYAVIHPYRHWLQVSDRHYESPITIAPMFNGVFWANFIGADHFQTFESARLKKMIAAKIVFLQNSGLFVLASQFLHNVDQDPVAETEMLRLNQFFKDALRADSDWCL